MTIISVNTLFNLKQLKISNIYTQLLRRFTYERKKFIEKLYIHIPLIDIYLVYILLYFFMEKFS